MTEVRITTEPDPVPIVRVLANQFRRRASDPEFLAALDKIEGPFSLASSTDPQRATITVAGRSIHIVRGTANDAKIVIHADLDDAGAKPRIENLWRHPLFALNVGKLLEDPPVAWRQAANSFWAACRNYPDMPEAICLHCTDESATLQLGEGEPDAHFFGTARTLGRCFGGQEILVVAATSGQLKLECRLSTIAKLSEVSKDLMLGVPD